MAEANKYVYSTDVKDLAQVRLPSTKPFEQMTISELVQLRPGTTAADSYNISVETTSVTVSSSKSLVDLAHQEALTAVKAVKGSAVTVNAPNMKLNAPDIKPL